MYLVESVLEEAVEALGAAVAENGENTPAHSLVAKILGMRKRLTMQMAREVIHLKTSQLDYSNAAFCAPLTHSVP